MFITIIITRVVGTHISRHDAISLFLIKHHFLFLYQQAANHAYKEIQIHSIDLSIKIISRHRDFASKELLIEATCNSIQIATRDVILMITHPGMVYRIWRHHQWLPLELPPHRQGHPDPNLQTLQWKWTDWPHHSLTESLQQIEYVKEEATRS